MPFRAASAAIATLVIAAPASLRAISITEHSTGVTITADPSGGYSVAYAATGWIFVGDTGAPLNRITSAAGTDSIGTYQELAFDYSVQSRPRQASIRMYINRPVVLFRVKYLAAALNTQPFPDFRTWPSGLHPFGFQSWNCTFAHELIEAGSPWLFFDSAANAFLFSPASEFIVSQIDLSDAGIASGINPAIQTLDASLEHSSLLAFGQGINTAFDTWGRALTDLYGKVRPANDADVSLAMAGLWTDNRSPYYYNPGEAGQGLIDAVSYYRGVGVKMGYIQADSWWYPKGLPPSWKNNGTGLYRLRADRELFPDDLAGFQQRAALPLVVHSRYWHEQSPDRGQYLFSGNVPIDPLYWKDLAQYLAGSGVAVFEQDWLSGPAVTASNLHDPDAFFDNMAQAMAERGINLQYSMPRARHYLQGAKYSNLTSIRASADGLARDRWDSLLFDSRLASALGIWPFTDNFKSDDVRNALLAALTAGPFGPSDSIGEVDRHVLRQALRRDGVVIKPDAPLVPVDATYLAIANQPSAPMIASTSTDFGTLKTAYVFAYSRPDSSEVAFSPASLGIEPGRFPQSLIYDYFARSSELVASDSKVRRTVDSNGSYFVVVPVGSSGVALLGDTSKFVTLGKKRISHLSDDGELHATVEFGVGENWVVLELFSLDPVSVRATSGAAHVIKGSPDHQRRRILVAARGGRQVNLTIYRQTKLSERVQ